VAPLPACKGTPALPALLASLLPALGLPILAAAPVQAGPVVCSTTLEALRGSSPVEVTRCGAVVTTPELVERRFYSYTAPFARGVAIPNQISDLLGLAIPGRDGGRIVGFGFPDQTIIWDGTAIGNTTRVLLEEQGSPTPWRTADVSNGFCNGLPQGGCGAAPAPAPAAAPVYPVSSYTPVRGLW
jgi:hypothetical protein